MPTIFLLSAIFAATFIHSLTGFGVALIAMPVAAALLGIPIATPLVALLGPVLYVALTFIYRKSLNLKAVWRLVAGSIFGIPIGVYAIRLLDEGVLLTGLGGLIIFYAVYALFNLRCPDLRHPAWNYAVGFLAGILSGAYNTPGPVVVVYGSCRQWSPDEFRSNLQGFFVVTSLVVAADHALNGNLTPVVWEYFWLSLPVMALGIWAGVGLGRRLNTAGFRRLVLGGMIGLGVFLIFSA